ncbi:glycosyltransferase family 4 protein [Planktothricoides raciborskii]|uniref:Glycosyltransferase family 4 protein n=1 Tax=Planktothricoides raciborskii GIHE-MW2 TaxID=2792601 RepID=A0AAU8JDQ3_9CYAN
MRILQLHNLYKIAGGEDVVVQAEKTLLEAYGHEVILLQADNHNITNFFSQTMTALNTVYSFSAKKRVQAEIAKFQPDVVHVHNFFPLWSPAVYDACQEAKVAVLQTLHNYRLLCAAGLLFRDGKVCEDCLGKLFTWPGVVHRCYRGSRVGSAVLATMQAVHRARGTWNERVNLYIAMTEFNRNKFIEAGLPADKIVLKPHFLFSDPQIKQGHGDYALFVGRLSPEKGIDTMLAAWRLKASNGLGEQVQNFLGSLKIVGDGPLADQVAMAAQEIPGVEWLGRQPQEQVQKLMQNAKLLVFPSECYEAFGMVILEAYSVGLPVVASNLGSLSSLVDSGRTGLHFRPGDADDLAAKVEWAIAHPQELAQMGREARAEFEAHYTAEANYRQLMEIYQLALGSQTR